MEADRFDAITRVFATRIGRRELLQGVLLAAAGGITFRMSNRETLAGETIYDDCDGDGILESLRDNFSNCGFCGNDCGNLGMVSPSCCTHECRDLIDDLQSCGYCGNYCAGDWPGCCYGQCVDFWNDTVNCGGCGNVCSENKPYCIAGVCHDPSSACNGQGLLCDGINCADTSTDPVNCGACGIVCANQSGFGMCCYGMCVDGQFFFSNCGSCGNDCATFGFSAPSCCDGTCVDLDWSTNHCGSCNVVCGQDQFCLNQQCVFTIETPTPTDIPVATAKPTSSPTPTTSVDKWGLWTGDVKLAGTTLYLRRLTAEDDPKTMSDLVVGPDYKGPDFSRIAKLGINYVEISHPAIYDEVAPYALDEPVRDHLDHLVRHAAKADLFTVISFRTGPGRSEVAPSTFPVCLAGGCFSGDAREPGSVRKPSRMWDDAAVQTAWVELWRETARRFSKNPVVIGYHILGMPDAPEPELYRQFLMAAIEAIREVDLKTPILVSSPGAGLAADLVGFEPLPFDQVVYRFDAFEPGRYLQQPYDSDNPLIYGDPFDADFDEAEGRFDREWIDDSLSLAVRWAADHRRPVMIGGFGMPRWQPGLADYLDDLLDLCDARRLNTGLWLWHPAKGPVADDAFNLEHGQEPDNHTIVPNPLIDVLAQHWSDIDIRPSTFAAP